MVKGGVVYPVHVAAEKEVEDLGEGGVVRARHRVLGQLLSGAEEGTHAEAQQLHRVLGGKALHTYMHR
jgi:hypothetical protein